jgi:hypothetical protein
MRSIYCRYSLFCYTTLMDLIPKQTRRIIYAFKVVVAFFLLLIGFFLLYYYVWHQLTTIIKTSVTHGQYVEVTTTSCTTDAACLNRCRGGSALGKNELCSCQKGYCVYFSDTRVQSLHKYCVQDNDCIPSCYEGPVSRAYYASVGGPQQDCSEGCILPDAPFTESGINNVVCKDHQCRFASGRICNYNDIPKATP